MPRAPLGAQVWWVGTRVDGAAAAPPDTTTLARRWRVGSATNPTASTQPPLSPPPPLPHTILPLTDTSQATASRIVRRHRTVRGHLSSPGKGILAYASTHPTR